MIGAVRCRRGCDPAAPAPWCYAHEGPYLVECPLCLAPPLLGCTGPAGWPRPPHARRVKAAPVLALPPPMEGLT